MTRRAPSVPAAPSRPLSDLADGNHGTRSITAESAAGLGEHQVNTRLTSAERRMLGRVAKALGIAPGAAVRLLIRERCDLITRLAPLATATAPAHPGDDHA